MLLLFVCECVGDEAGVFQNIQFALVSEKFYKLFMIRFFFSLISFKNARPRTLVVLRFSWR